MHDLFAVELDGVTLLCNPTSVPSDYYGYRENALVLEEDIGGESFNPLKAFFLAIIRNRESYPAIVIAQSYDPADSIFPGALYIPETHILFVGFGRMLYAFHLDKPEQLWWDTNDTGFHRWRQHGSFVLMSAERELAAWDIYGKKLWSMFMLPPWDYHVEDKIVYADRMGEKLAFPIQSGSDKWWHPAMPKEK